MPKPDALSISNTGGLRLDVTSIGGAITRLLVPDRDGTPVDVVLGLEDPAAYAGRPAFLGALIGRFGNRIRNGEFEIDGTRYRLARNDPPNHLHGGDAGFDVREWTIRHVDHPEGACIELTLVSPDGDEGYPGRLEMLVRYVLSDDGALIITYDATSDRPTILNPTQHSYFNLAGHASGDILDHRLTIASDRFTPTDSSQIPTGVIQPVEGTALDFRQPRRIGDSIDADDPHIRIGAGYDHNFVLSDEPGIMRFAAQVSCDTTGIMMAVHTDQPGIQFYSGNHLDGIIGKDGAVYNARTGLCLETQHFPDSPNQPHFPSTVLRPGERFRSRTEYRFSRTD